MKMQLETPKAVVDAREAKKGLNWFLEFLVFVAVIVVVKIGQGIITTPVELYLLFTDEAYLDAVAAADMQMIIEASMAVASKPLYVVTMLFSTIAMIAIPILFCKLIQKRKSSTLGFVKKDMLKEYGIGLGVGFGIFTVAVLLCVVTGSLQFNGFSSTFSIGWFVLFGLGFMIQGMAEEVLCRGYSMTSIGRRYPMWVAVILNALFFAALHLGNMGLNVLGFVNLILFGVFASVYFVKRGSIWGIGAVHSIWNFAQGNIYGIKVSGMTTSCTVLESVSVEGREIINGGAFGLEGGLAVTIVLVAGTMFLLTRPAKDAAVCDAAEENATQEAQAEA